MTFKRVVGILSLFIAFGLCLFVVVWLARTGSLSGELDTHELAVETVGYCIAPYNQQAALIDGAMVFEGMGKGYNWTQWFWKFPILQNQIDPRDYLGTIPPYGVYERLEAMTANGFEPRFTALSAFGNSYVDFGWLGFLPFVPYGFVGAWMWAAFQVGSTGGHHHLPDVRLFDPRMASQSALSAPLSRSDSIHRRGGHHRAKL